ncbi:impB/mucB/samB family protein [Kineothrix alysoides]|uniref:ImpB/mucB/samB family protein n=1 Tax=Kineothrix alysoides TaxID=1469948 RepID=A0A4R1QVA2_9FIRM|nr:hypothetical protein [Kineothrix alysoides]TCL54090.1 impB/mucB/samB family protein [Kineothrix alysoides]
MNMKNRTYIAIDLKSFYASVECIERQLDPLTTNLVVADAARTEKTICLAVADIKAYKPSTTSIGSGQVLQHAYTFGKAKLIVREMTDLLVLDLVDKRLVTDQLVLTVGYDIENLTDPKIKESYHGAVTTDHYGRSVPICSLEEREACNPAKLTITTGQVKPERFLLFWTDRCSII